nr:unnamed protein product [Callosobruchus analis]
MYDVASHAATADLHWEVIEKHLTHQGMIDGTFPEVKKRLIKVLEQLSATGCLAVFAAALQDDSDLEVAKTALDLIKDFVGMLKKYKVTEQDLVSSTPVIDSVHPDRRSHTRIDFGLRRHRTVRRCVEPSK